MQDFPWLLLLSAVLSFLLVALPLAPLSAQQPPADGLTPPNVFSITICSKVNNQSIDLVGCILILGTILLRILLAVALIGAVVVFVLGGLTYIIAGPDKEKRKTASAYLIYSLVGLTAALLAFTVVSALRLYIQGLKPESR